MGVGYFVMTRVKVPSKFSMPFPVVPTVTLAVPGARALPPALYATVPSFVPFEVTSKTDGLSLIAVMVVPFSGVPKLQTTVSPTLIGGTGWVPPSLAFTICGVRMIGGSTFPTVEEEDLAVVVGAAVVVDEESFLSELPPATARQARACTAQPAVPYPHMTMPTTRTVEYPGAAACVRNITIHILIDRFTIARTYK